MNLFCSDIVFILSCSPGHLSSFFFFFNDTATTEIYTLSLHDALPIYSAMPWSVRRTAKPATNALMFSTCARTLFADRKSTRLNSSHGYISYAVFCLKKKNSDSNPHTLFYLNKQAHKPATTDNSNPVCS